MAEPIFQGSGAAKRLLTMHTTHRVCHTGFFNSNGYKDANGMITQLMRHLSITALVTQVGTAATTINTTNSDTGASGGNTFYPGDSSQHGYSKAQGSATAGGYLDTSNIQDHVSLVPELAKRYRFGRVTRANSIEYNPIHRGLLWKAVNAMGATVAASGLDINQDKANANDIDRTAALRFDIWAGEGTPEGGSFRIAQIENSVPNSVISATSTITVPVNANPTNMVCSSLAIAAGARNSKIRVGPSAPSAGHYATGQIFLGLMLLYRNDAVPGYFVSPFFALGGQSVYDFAYTMARGDSSAIGDEAIDHWIDVHVRPSTTQSLDPVMCVWINDGSNLSSEAGNSILGNYSNQTADGYAENVQYIIDRWRTRWLAKGYKQANLFFALHPDHPSYDTTVNNLENIYRTQGAAKVIAANPNQVFSVNGDSLFTTTELLAGSGAGQPYYARGSGTLSASAVATGVGSTVVSVVNSGSNAINVGERVVITSSNSTPNINGTWEVIARSDTQITLNLLDLAVTGSGSAATVRKVDPYHLSVNGVSGATNTGYSVYVQRIFEQMALIKLPGRPRSMPVDALRAILADTLDFPELNPLG